MKYWGKIGAFWGGLWGLLFGSAMFAIPGLGPIPILVAGPLVAGSSQALKGRRLLEASARSGRLSQVSEFQRTVFFNMMLPLRPISSC